MVSDIRVGGHGGGEVNGRQIAIGNWRNTQPVAVFPHANRALIHSPRHALDAGDMARSPHWRLNGRCGRGRPSRSINQRRRIGGRRVPLQATVLATMSFAQPFWAHLGQLVGKIIMSGWLFSRLTCQQSQQPYVDTRQGSRHECGWLARLKRRSRFRNLPAEIWHAVCPCEGTSLYSWRLRSWIGSQPATPFGKCQ